MTSILIIDDEENIRKLGQTIFSSIGMDVHLAKDGSDGVDKAIDINPDIILLDVIMPNKNGFDTCKEIRNTEAISNTPIIMVSAMGDEYNKITGFEGGADDYVTKPYNIEELKARVKSLLMRNRPKPSLKKDKSKVKQSLNKPSDIDQLEPLIDCDFSVDLIASGLPVLDSILYGGLPVGSNILVTGPIGKGKSSFAREFIKEGLTENEKCLFIAVDDDPTRIRTEISYKMGSPISELEADNQIQFVDAYSWSSLTPTENDPFAIHGALELNQLSGVISDSSSMLGHSVQQKCGGRRVIDSISSFFINFDLPSIQRFLNQITRTSVAFGNVTTLFLLEQGTITEQTLNNIKYIMDGVIEFDDIDENRSVRVSSMKWTRYSSDWKRIPSMSAEKNKSEEIDLRNIDKLQLNRTTSSADVTEILI